jgi:predicted transport protein
MELNITNNAADVPFSFIVQDLLTGNIEKSEAKYVVYKKMRGIAAINLQDIETAISLHFNHGKLTIEQGVSPDSAVVITTQSDKVMDLNMLRVRWGLPYYFDEAGRNVLGLLLGGKIKIKGLLSHPVLLTRLTIIMSVI